MASFLKKHKFDFILVGSLTILAVIFLICFYSFKTEGSYVTVTVNKVEIGTYSLSEDGEYVIGDENYNILVIKDGAAYIKEATCPDKLCVRQGKVKADGEQLICLPSKTIFTVYSDSKSKSDF